PPYNTGNESWVYNDNVNSPEIQAWLGEVVGKEAEDLSRHDKWLCMMYPRLVLLRELLHENGSFWMSIDDNEVHHSRLILDEIFGERNFIASVIWQKKQSPQNDAINISDMHDFVLVYAKRAKANKKDLQGWQRNLLPRMEKQNKRYKNPDNDLRGDWSSGDCTCNKTVEERPNLYYPIKNPNTGEDIWPSRVNVWRYEKSYFEKLIAENRIWWGKTGENFPRFKRFFSSVPKGIVPSTWWSRVDAGDNQEARREARRIISDSNDFSTPKPTRLIRQILRIATKPGDLVLDSFVGSGTTGHAVMQINQEDDGNRRFILVEMEPDIAQNITAQRLRKAIEGYTWEGQRGKVNQVEGLGGGFRYCILDAPLFGADGQIRSEVTFSELARHVFFTETGEPLPAQTSEVSETSEVSSPLLGVADGRAIYLLFNGILGDKSEAGGNVLTRQVLEALPPHDGPKVIYGEGCLLSKSILHEMGITFRQLPYEVRVN
ncbi:MAG: site-specific DNA-methyltransferase, partial [Chloroflexota bacterium]